MIYNSVAEIFEEMSATRERLFERVEGLSAAQENFRPSADAWTVAEIVEHLAILEHRIAQLANVMVTKSAAAASSDGGDTDGATPVRFEPFSLDHFVERARVEKYTAPENVRPRGDAPVADSLAKLRLAREQILALRPRIETTDLSVAEYPHPVFGPLNLYRWLVVTGVHEARHINQMDALMQSPEFKSLESN